MTLRLLDTFSGIGGFSYAAERIVGGFETVAFVEREPYCQQILGKHWPNVPIYDDITTFSPEPYSADVVCGGFPCQDISTAGKQAGIKEGTRSGLFYELIRVVRLVRPRYVVLENVAAIVSNGLDTVLGELAEAGFDCEWACIPASAVGACHQRDRWWCVAYPKRQRSDEGATGEGLRRKRQEEMPQLGATWFNGSRELSRPVAGGESVTEAPNSTGEQRHDGGFAHPARAAGAAAKLGNCDGSDIANPSSPRLERRWPSGSTAHRLSPDWRSYVSEPVLCRGDDGLSGRVDRLKALGNAVVPHVAAIPLARVRQLAGV
jgi:DNA (cytosine-5)-methyltransferase 1